MGPRPCGRGRISPSSSTASPVLLQWGHGLAAVDGLYALFVVSQNTSFNGATALRPWTGWTQRRTRDARASFNGATALRPWTGLRSASRAMAFELQWGHGLAAVDGCARRPHEQATESFNGATALRPWTALVARHLGAADGLQWGHGLAAVDGMRRVRHHPPRVRASMGPRPCGRGRRRRPRLRRQGRPASMGPRPCGRGRR